MAIKAGQILHVGNQFLLDRLQTAGPGDLNIPTEKIYELGNRQSVAVVRDIPDLSFTADALDVSTEIEALLVGSNGDGTTTEETGTVVPPDAFGLDGVTGTSYNLADAKPIDITSPWRTSNSGSNFAAVRGVVVPNLYLESAAYTYGLTDNAGESFTLRGDSIFYVPGHPYTQTAVGDGTETDFPFTPANLPTTPAEALLYVEQGKDLYALSVSVDSYRKLPGVDYTETPTGITFLVPPANGADIRIVYGSAKGKDYSQAVHQGTSVKPAAIRGKDIQVFIGLGSGSLPFFWTGVQSISVNWSVTLEDDFEFGNPRAVARDFADVPAVTGSLDIKPASVDDLFAKIRQIAGVTDPLQVVGPQSSVLLPLEIRLLNPESGGIPKGTDIPGGDTGVDVYDSGTVLKTLYIPDARFTLPGYSGQVQQKLVQTINFESDTGILEIFRGLRF